MGIEANNGSRFGPLPEPVAIETPRYHDFLTLKLAHFSTPPRRAGAGCDGAPRPGDSHKGAKAQRPPQVQGRGQGTKGVYAVVKRLLAAEEHHLMTRDTKASRTHSLLVTERGGHLGPRVGEGELGGRRVDLQALVVGVGRQRPPDVATTLGGVVS